MIYTHVSVMPDEVIYGLNIKPGGVYLDGTLGGAGHAALIAQKLETGRLIGIDRDGSAVAYACEKLRPYGECVTAVRGNYSESREILRDLGVPALDGVLLDLGVSSHQLDTPERGFSYRQDARLDMRMDDRDSLTAFDVVNAYSEKRLTEIMFSYGEERFSKRIARAIVNTRLSGPIETTAQLSEIVTNAVPAKARAENGHPAKRTFQAIRIEVNDELRRLDAAVRDLVSLLKPGGRICVITFHSLEDRIVKHCFKSLANPCECPRDLPMCVCGKKPSLTIVTRKPMLPGEVEQQNNSRSHSAKLRIAERLAVL